MSHYRRNGCSEQPNLFFIEIILDGVLFTIFLYVTTQEFTMKFIKICFSWTKLPYIAISHTVAYSSLIWKYYTIFWKSILGYPMSPYNKRWWLLSLSFLIWDNNSVSYKDNNYGIQLQRTIKQLHIVQSYIIDNLSESIMQYT